MRICFFGKPDSPQLRRVVASLADRGHDIHVVYHGLGSVPGATYEAFDVPRGGLRRPQRWHVRKQRYLQHFLDDFDVVSIQFLHSWGFTPEMMQSGCFTVRPWGSDISPPPGGPQPPDETVARRREMLHCARAVAVTCNSFRETVAEYAGIKPAGIAMTPLGVDLAEFEPASPPAGPPVVGFLKGFGHAYGAVDLVRAMPRIVETQPDVVFELVGDGPLLPTCHELAIELGVMSHIRWLPRLAPHKVRDTLARWSLSVIPSVTESFCIAALESSAMHVPVVANSIGGLCETVCDGETGLLVQTADANAFAEAVLTLLNDPKKRKKMGDAGRVHVETNFEWQHCMDTWEAFFHGATAGTETTNCELQTTS